MSARKQGGVLVRERKLGRIYALRFRVYGERQYLTLGYEHEGWDLDKANLELQKRPRRRSPRPLAAAEEEASGHPRAGRER